MIKNRAVIITLILLTTCHIVHADCQFGDATKNLGVYGEFLDRVKAVDPHAHSIMIENMYQSVVFVPALNEAVPAIEKVLRDRDGDIVSEALCALAEIQQEEASSTLANALKDLRPTVRYHAADALLRVGDARAAQALVQVLKDDNEYYDIKSLAAGALHRMSCGIEVDIFIAFLIGEGVLSSEDEDIVKIGPENKKIIQIIKAQGNNARWLAALVLGGNHRWFCMRDEVQIIASALKKALKDKDEKVRAATAHALGSISNTYDIEIETTSELKEALSDDSFKVRLQAAFFLSDSDEAVPVLIEALKHEKQSIRHKALMAYSSSKGYRKADKKAAAFIIAALEDQDEYLQLEALDALAFPDEHTVKKAVPHLISLLKDNNRDIRFWAASVLGEIGPKAKDAVLALIQLLDDEDPWLRKEAAWAIESIGPAAKDAVRKLIQMLNDESDCMPDVPYHATMALGGIGPAAIDAVPVLIERLNGKYFTSSAEALGKIGPAAKSAVPLMIKALKDSDNDRFKEIVLSALSGIGPEVAGVMPTIIHYAMNDEFTDVRAHTAEVLGELGPDVKKVIPTLIKMLKDKEPWVHRSAAIELGKMGPAAKRAAPALVKALRVKDEDICEAISEAIILIKPDPGEIIPGLAKILRSKYSNARKAAAVTIGKFGLEAAGAVPALIQALSDKKDRVRAAAAEALGRIGPGAKQAVPALIQALEDEDYWVFLNTINALGNIGPAAKEAIPALVKAKERKFPDSSFYYGYKKSIDGTLKKIGPAKEKNTSSHKSHNRASRPRIKPNPFLLVGFIGFMVAVFGLIAYMYFSPNSFSTESDIEKIFKAEQDEAMEQVHEEKNKEKNQRDS